MGVFHNFVAKFVVDVALEVAIQAATGQDIDLGAAGKSAALGLIDPTKTARKAARLGEALNDGRKARGATKAGPSCAICFTAGTVVDTAEGLRPIEDIVIGDKVWAWDEDTGITTLKSVIDTIPSHDRTIWNVTFQTPENINVTIETTHEHPWWVNGTGWVETQDLQSGMIAKTRDGNGLLVSHVVNTQATQATYNLTVADFATYYVGEQKVLVHNCTRTSTSQMQREVKKGGAPRDIDRVDKAHRPGTTDKDHVHFKDGTSCNCDGTTHDKRNGTPNPSRKAREWLKDNGWTPPPKKE